MGLIQSKDNRPRDWAYKAVFKEKDLPSLEAMAKHIRETHDTVMIEDFNRKCEQKLRGENAEIEGIEIEAVTKTGDLVVNGGLDQCIRIIQGTSTVRWSHFGMSQGNTPAPAVTDITIFENATIILFRVPLAWNEPVGMRLYFGGISSQTDPSSPTGVAPFSPNIVGEIGVYNSAIAGAILLNRSQFLSNALSQSSPAISTLESAPIVVSSVIEFCPVV